MTLFPLRVRVRCPVGSGTVRTTERLQQLLAYMRRRVRRRGAIGKLWYYAICDMMVDELDDRQELARQQHARRSGSPAPVS